MFLRFSSVKLKTEILFLSAFLFFVEISLTIGQALNWNAVQKDELILRQQEAFALRCDHINHVVAILENGARQLAMLATLREINPRGERYNLVNLTLSFFERSSITVGGGVWYEPYKGDDPSAKFNCVYACKKNGKFVYVPEFASEKYNYLETTWYRSIWDEGNLTGDVVWVKPYRDTEGTFAYMTTIGCCFQNVGDETVGMVTIDYKMDDILTELSAFRPTESSQLIFADVFHDTVLFDSRASKDIVGSLFSIPWIKDIQPGVRSLAIDGVEHVTFLKYLDNGMAIYLCIPSEELFYPLFSKVRNTLLFLIVFAGLFLVVCYHAMNKLICVPIASIAEQAEKIGAGNFDISIKLKVHNELYDLAQCINKMAAELNDYIAKARDLVREKERISTELDIAAQIQRSLLPNILPEFTGRGPVSLSAAMVPAKEVGGDLYDFYYISPTKIVITIGDVSGKGIAASLFMAISKTLLRNNVRSHPSLAKAVALTNDQLCERNEVNVFVTAWIGIFDLITGDLTYINAGHNMPVICNNGKVDFLQINPNLVLGAMDGMDFKEEHTKLELNDWILLYTDGVNEATNTQNELYGNDRLIAEMKLRATISPKQIIGALYESLDGFVMGAEQSDDITMLCLKYLRKPEKSDIISRNGFEVTDMKNELLWDIVVPASIESFAEVNDNIEKNLSIQNCSESKINRLLFAFEEFFVNVASYAYPNSDGSIYISLTHVSSENKNYFLIQMRDKGLPFDPTLRPDPDVTLQAEDRPIGGLGIYLSGKLIDKITYERENGENVLSIYLSA